jgi:hypothetical protein
MHIRALTKKSPQPAQTDMIVFVLDVIAAIISVASQVNSLVVSLNSKNAES